MARSIFLLQPDSDLVELREERYDSEALLQELLASYPQLLVGDGSDGAPPRLMLIKREAGVTEEQGGNGRWSLDHLLVDQEGVPVLVEVKRSTDTRIRRELIGQMLDYAAHAATSFTATSVRMDFELTCSRLDVDPAEKLTDLLGAEADQDAFWTRVGDNLSSGRMRLVFVADELPREVRRVIEFLNDQMSPAEVLGVEVKQFVDPERGLRTLVPATIGQTTRAQAKKQVVRRRSTHVTWDEAMVLADLQERHGVEARRCAERIIGWARSRGLEAGFIGGEKQGSMYFLWPTRPEPQRFLFIHSYGALGLGFGRIKQSIEFAADATRAELAARFEMIPGVVIKNHTAGPVIKIELLRDESALSLLFEALDAGLAMTGAR